MGLQTRQSQRRHLRHQMRKSNPNSIHRQIQARRASERITLRNPNKCTRLRVGLVFAALRALIYRIPKPNPSSPSFVAERWATKFSRIQLGVEL